MNYNWRYYRILSYVCFFLALYLSYKGSESGFYEYLGIALFLEIKDHLQQIENKIKPE